MNSSLSDGIAKEGGWGGRVFKSGLSVFFPAFNDARSLPDLLATTFATLRRFAPDHEVIVIDDGSSDDTGEVLERLRQFYAPYLRIVTHEENRGYGAALRSGFASATKEFVFYTDGDGQYDPSDLAAFLQAVTPGTGLVNGYKMKRQDPPHRVAIGWLYNQFARRLFQIRLRDIDCDFRLIRRSILEKCELSSTSGTICVELVRRIEMSGAEVIELPVRHYPRLHGRSEFFRIRSLVTTFLQLCDLFLRLVLLPLWRGQTRGPRAGMPTDRLSRRSAIFVCLAIVVLSLLAYARALHLPLIADDYSQIALGRRFGPVSGWTELLHDALYRCRTTSILLTYWTDRWFGGAPIAFNLSSLILHMVNSMLVFAMGTWRAIGWRVSAVAACYFAVSQRHHEAVIWYAALPELLVFLFVLLSFLCWVRWLQSESGSRLDYWGAIALYCCALLSKESAVALPLLLLLAGVVARRNLRTLLIRLLPFAVLAAGYFWLIYSARHTHLHFNDAGTFSLDAPFVRVILWSSKGLLWFWGFVAALGLAVWRVRGWSRQLWIAALWGLITFLPYSFLTYMPFVPSRHTYMASVGLALLMAVSLIEFHARTAVRHGRAAVAVLAAVIVIQQCGYLWTKKQAQFEVRARPTERLLKIAAQSRAPIHVKCFPYHRSVAELALEIRGGTPDVPPLIFDQPGGTGGGIDFCFDDGQYDKSNQP